MNGDWNELRLAVEFSLNHHVARGEAMVVSTLEGEMPCGGRPLALHLFLEKTFVFPGTVRRDGVPFQPPRFPWLFEHGNSMSRELTFPTARIEQALERYIDPLRCALVAGEWHTRFQEAEAHALQAHRRAQRVRPTGAERKLGMAPKPVSLDRFSLTGYSGALAS